MEQRPLYTFVNRTKSATLATKGRLADTWFARMRGLLGTNKIEQGEGLFLMPCNSIHMFWMKYAIDAIFVDRHGKVVAVVSNIKPWQMSAVYWQAKNCLELPPGTICDTGTDVGDQLEWQ
ncbi:MAG TPA: DUF192 domain-containing protein [Trichormus sp.]